MRTTAVLVLIAALAATSTVWAAPPTPRGGARKPLGAVAKTAVQDALYRNLPGRSVPGPGVSVKALLRGGAQTIVGTAKTLSVHTESGEKVFVVSGTNDRELKPVAGASQNRAGGENYVLDAGKTYALVNAEGNVLRAFQMKKVMRAATSREGWLVKQQDSLLRRLQAPERSEQTQKLASVVQAGRSRDRFANAMSYKHWSPFTGDLADFARTVWSMKTGRGTPADVLKGLYRDKFMELLGKRMNLPQILDEVAKGRPFDKEAFRNASEAAVDDYMAKYGELAQELLEAKSPAQTKMLVQQKLDMVALALEAGTAPSAIVRLPGKPQGSMAMETHPFTAIFGEGNTEAVGLERVRGAKLLRLTKKLYVPGRGETRESRALYAYGRDLPIEVKDNKLVTPKKLGATHAAMSYQEVGRAVVGPEIPQDKDSAVITEDLMKGVGPTKFAGGNNRFNSKATGAFSVQEAMDDWNNSERLKRAGVPVYEPVAVVMFPSAEWHDTKGWKPLGNYVRRPEENLRISELDLMSAQQKTLALERLKTKVRAVLARGGRGNQPVSDTDVIRFTVERMGRTAGLFDGGGFKGKYYFHGMLHRQNISMLGEICDVGKNPGVLGSKEEVQKEFKRSNYPGWSYGPWKRPTRERGVFLVRAHDFNQGLAEVTGGGLSDKELESLFWTAYNEGRSGVKANDPARALKRITAASAANE